MRLSGLHDWPCPPFGGLFYARRFPRIALRLSGLHSVPMGRIAPLREEGFIPMENPG